MTHQKVPPPGREQLRDPAAEPLLEYQSICPPRGSPFKQCKAIFYQHHSFSKAAPMPGECIMAASWAHLPEQHLGGHSRFLSGSPQEGDSDKESIQLHHELMTIKNHFGSHMWSEKVRSNQNTAPFLLLLSAFHYQILKWMKEKPELPFDQCKHNKAAVMKKKKLSFISNRGQSKVIKAAGHQ